MCWGVRRLGFSHGSADQLATPGWAPRQAGQLGRGLHSMLLTSSSWELEASPGKPQCRGENSRGHLIVPIPQALGHVTQATSYQLVFLGKQVTQVALKANGREARTPWPWVWGKSETCARFCHTQKTAQQSKQVLGSCCGIGAR